MKARKLLQGLGIFLLLAGTMISLAYADHSLGLTAFWTETENDSLSVAQGEPAELFVSVTSTDDFTLWMEVLQGATVVRTLLPGVDIPGGIDDTFANRFMMDTGLLAGDYVLRVHAANGEDDDITYLNLRVETIPALSVDPDRLEMNEGEKNFISVLAADADGDTVSIEARQEVCLRLFGRPICGNISLPSTVTFVDTAEGEARARISATFDFVTHPAQSRELHLLFRASDGENTSPWAPATVIVNDVNRLPEITSVPLEEAQEGTPYEYRVTARDADDEDTLTFTLIEGPTGMSMSRSGRVRWTPDFTAAGNHPVVLRVSDGIDRVTQYLVLNVENTNRAPVLEPLEDQPAVVGALVEFTATAADADDDALSFSFADVPENAIFRDNGDGTATFSWTPTAAHVAEYDVEVIVSDGELDDIESVHISVAEAAEEVNQAPVLNFIGDKTVNEGELLQFLITAADADDDLLFFMDTGTFPAGSVLADNGNGTAAFSWTPGMAQAGDYSVLFQVSDGALIDEEIITITVEDVIAPEVPGCTDPAATNFNPGATADDGSCAYEPPPVEVCDDGLDNDGDGLVDEGCPIPPVEVCGDGLDNDGDSLVDEGCPVPCTDTDGDGLCDEVDGVIVGCTDPAALNFRPQAGVDDGSCIFPELDDILELTRVQLSDDVVAAGGSLLLSINVANEGDLDLENLRITVLAYDFGINRTTSRFDLHEGRTTRKSLTLPVPAGTSAGEYLLKITVGNSGHRESAYRIVHVS